MASNKNTHQLEEESDGEEEGGLNYGVSIQLQIGEVHGLLNGRGTIIAVRNNLHQLSMSWSEMHCICHPAKITTFKYHDLFRLLKPELPNWGIEKSQQTLTLIPMRRYN